MPNLPPTIYQLKITLLDIDPPIWRRITFPASFRLCCLDTAIQTAMGWTNSHLHQFEKDDQSWGVPEWDDMGDFDWIDESKTRLGGVLLCEGESLKYQYDFGDDWEHEVELEKILPAKDAAPKPSCLAGERRCPPEDVGGVYGYHEFLEAILDPNHGDYDRYRRWAGGHFLDEFDVKAVNKTLAAMRWPIRHRR